MIDYKGIIDKLNIEAIIELMKNLGAEDYIEKDTYIQFQTICHNEDITDASHKLYFYKESKLFVCYTECGTMNIFQFLKTYYETRNIQYNWYNDIYKVILSCSTYKKLNDFNIQLEKISTRFIKNNMPELPIYNDTVLQTFIKFYPPEWLEDGITKETMDKFNILYSIGQNKIIIPHYNVNNELIGIRGRALNPEEVEQFGKYMPVQVEKKWYSHPLSLNLYGLNKTKEDIKKNKICYLFEGEKSVMIMDSFNLPNCSVAVCGSNFNKYQLKILMKECHPQEIVICFDNEEESNKKYFDKLYSIGKKYSNYCNFSFIYDRKNLTDKKDAPVDKGEEIFRELLQRRIAIK